MNPRLVNACAAASRLRAARTKLQWQPASPLAATRGLHHRAEQRVAADVQRSAANAPRSAAAIQARCFASQAQETKKTPLYDVHVQRGGKMVPYAGFQMPVQYADLSVRDSHIWTREKSSIFDVSHMVQHQFQGPGAQGLLERVTPASLASLQPHYSGLSTFLFPGTGGIVDDGIITRLGPELFYVVTNAGCRDKDLAFIKKSIDEWHADGNEKVEWTLLDDHALVALQGPLSADILERLLVDPQEVKLHETYFGQSRFVQLQLPGNKTSSRMLVSRGGYTGEDGFEISIPANEASQVVEQILNHAGPERVRLAGLGARDSLRLEAGMCLYGHDLDEATTPVEASLSWVIGKDRRQEGAFNGSEVILRQLRPKKEGGGVERRRVGLVVEGAPAREGAIIVDADDNQIGRVTSGCPSPSLGKNIAMAYVTPAFVKAGSEVGVVVRGKRRPAVVTKMPFVPSKYWKGGLSPG